MRLQKFNSTAIYAASALLGVTCVTQAQESTLQLEEVVVSAQRTSAASLQDTPLSITAFSSNMLEDTHFENLQNIQALTPSLEINSTGNAYIRGVGTNLNFPGSDPSVATFVDGVYISNTDAILTDLIGVERVEVLKGPQGTLYGRNAAGGVISVTSKRPSEETSGRFLAEWGSFSRLRIGAGISGPLAENLVYGSFAIQTIERDGHIKNAFPEADCFCQADHPPGDFSGEDSKSFRGQLFFTPSEALEITVAADYSRDDSLSRPKTIYSDTYGNDLRGVPYLTLGTPTVIEDPYTISLNMTNQYEWLENTGYSAKIKYKISDYLSLTSITAFRELESDFRGDTDNTDISTIGSNIAVDQDQFSQEIQLNYNTGNFDLVAGLYYFNEDFAQDAIIELPYVGTAFGIGETYAARFLSPAETEAIAAFVQVDYHITDDFSINAGIRYSEEDKQIDRNTYSLLDGARLVPVEFAPAFDPAWLLSSEDATFDAWTPKFGAQYNINSEMMVYASITRGFKSGGFNFSDGNDAFDPEYLWAYEVGLKADWLDGRLRTNFSAFLYEYEDLQVQAFILASETSTGVAIFNAADATIEGFEMDLTAQITEELIVTASATWLDATYDQFLTARDSGPNEGVPVNVEGNTLNQAPEFAYAVTMQYEKILDVGAISLRGEYSWRDDQYNNFFNDSAYSEDAYGIANFYASLSKDQWKVTLYARNLTDEVYSTGAQNFAETGIAKFIELPRTYGVIFTYDF